MWPGSDQAHFMAMKCPKAILARDINISLGFSVGALKNAMKILKFSLKFESMSTLLKQWYVKRKVKLLLQNLFSDSKILIKIFNSLNLMLQRIGDGKVFVL